MRINKRLLLICIAIPLIGGAIASLFTMSSMATFDQISKPAFSPPGWLFPIVWTILYTLMGISSYLVLTSDADKEDIENALKIYAYQLVVNFLWPTFFFNFGWYLFSFIWLVLLWILVLVMIVKFSRINKLAAYLNIPYLLWLTFAAYLNWSIYTLT